MGVGRGVGMIVMGIEGDETTKDVGTGTWEVVVVGTGKSVFIGCPVAKGFMTIAIIRITNSAITTNIISFFLYPVLLIFQSRYINARILQIQFTD